MRAPVAAILVFIGAVQGCGAPPSPTGNDLALGDDKASGKRKSGPTSSDSGEGATPGSIELGSGTKGSDPAPGPSRGDQGDTSSSQPAPNTCTTDAQCNQLGRICTTGACVKGCRDSASCPTNQVCTAGQCGLASSSVQCSADYECALGAICTASACKPGCHASYDCPTGQTCTAGMCKVAATTTTTPPPVGATPCASDGACNPGVNGSGQICSAQGTCVAGCHKDNQCPGSKICVTGMCR